MVKNGVFYKARVIEESAVSCSIGKAYIGTKVVNGDFCVVVKDISGTYKETAKKRIKSYLGIEPIKETTRSMTYRLGNREEVANDLKDMPIYKAVSEYLAENGFAEEKEEN